MSLDSSDAAASQYGDSLPAEPRNRNVICKGRTVIRWQYDEGNHRKGDPVLDEDNGRTYRPCRGYGANGTDYCAAHGGSAPQTIAVAQRTLALGSDDYATIIRRIARDETAPLDLRLKAAAQGLDRVGIRAGVDVGIETPKWQAVLGKLFERVEDDEELAPTEPVQETPKKASRAPARAKPRKAVARKATPPSTKPKFEGWG